MSHGSKQEYPWLSSVSRGWKAYQKSFSSGKDHAREALDLFARAAEQLRSQEDAENLPLALDGMGAALHLLGSLDDLKRAQKCYDEEIRLLGKARNPQELAQAISSQQAVLRDLALLDPGSAFAYLEKGLKLGDKGMTLAAKSRDERSLAWVSQTTADLCCVLARIDKACSSAHLEVAVDLYQKAGLLWDRVATRGRPRKSAAEDKPQPVSTPREAAEGRALTQLGLVEAYIMLGRDLDKSRTLLGEVRELYSKPGGGAYQMGHVLSLYGSLALAEGDREQAEARFLEARETFKRLGFSIERGEAAWT